MIRARLRESIRSTGWVQTMWACPSVREQIERRVKTTAGIWKISQGEIESIRLPLPPLSEQTRIVGEVEKQLTRLDAGVEALKRVQAQAQALPGLGPESRVRGAAGSDRGRTRPPREARLRTRRQTPRPHPQGAPRPLGGRSARQDESGRQAPQGRQLEGKVRRAVEPRNRRCSPRCPRDGAGHVSSNCPRCDERVTGLGESTTQQDGPLSIGRRTSDRCSSAGRGCQSSVCPRLRRGNTDELSRRVILACHNHRGESLRQVGFGAGFAFQRDYVSQHVGLARPIETGISAFLVRLGLISPAHGRRYLDEVCIRCRKTRPYTRTSP